MMKKTLKILGGFICLLLVLVMAYVLYVVITYDRIPDKQVLKPEGEALLDQAETGREYTVVTQNCGFGAYSPDFTFFMDGGTESWAKSEETARANIDMAGREIHSLDPDFVLLQEVDTDSTRSYHLNQKEQLAAFFPALGQVFAVNFHSAFLMYPFTQPHGTSNSGILTLSRMNIRSALRRSLKISESFSKFLDLDRCYSVSRIPVNDGKELVLYNVHNSAYGGTDEVRTAQIKQLTEDMYKEYSKGNYCVCGGDFNHDFTGDSSLVLGGSESAEYGWAKPFPTDLLPEGITQCLDYDDKKLVPTCRNCDVPYGPDCDVFVVDGFLVSDNVSVTELHNIDARFAYSDHNPVLMRFKLNSDH